MNILETLLEKKKLSLLWQGNNGFLIWNGQKLIATDLDLYNEERIAPPTVDSTLLCEKLDALFLTHEHEDHFSTKTVSELIEKGHCQFIIPKSCEEKAKKLGVPKKRLILSKPGDTVKLPFVRALCTKAIHGHKDGSIYSGASMLDCGYIFDFGGQKIYEPGDTVLLEEHFSMRDIDVLFVSPTEHNTKIKGSVLLIQAIKPHLIVAQHHSTYVQAEDNLFWTHGYINELGSALPPEYQAKYKIPTQKQIIEL